MTLKWHYFAYAAIFMAGSVKRRNLNSWVVLTGIGILILGFPLQRAMAADVPFSTANIIDGSFDGAHYVYAADIDGDGDTDVLGAASNAGEIAWWENMNADGTSWTKHSVDDNFAVAYSVCAADVDGDGDMDVLGSSWEDHDITWWENNNGAGTDWTEHVVDGDFGTAFCVYAADVDGDDDIDVLGASNSLYDITWWENTNGAGTAWTEHTIDGDFKYARHVYAEDIDGDDDMDVLGVSLGNDDITWWENNNGVGTNWTEHTIDGGFSDPEWVYAADVDGDTDMDVIGAGEGVDAVSWWENTDGLGTAWTKHIVESDWHFASSVYAADVDADGDVDILGSDYDISGVTWWENMNGLGTDWLAHDVNGGVHGGSSVYAADIDGDGDVDILEAAYHTDDIAWWENLLRSEVCCADFNGDLFVNFRDFCILAQEWLQEGDLLQTDLVDDNKINELDLGALSEQWLRPCYQCSQADIYSDGKIDFKDYSLLAGNWQGQGPLAGDITGNGTVDMGDLKALLFHWLTYCPATVWKPNIYLYPEETTELDVYITFPHGGRVTTSIPNYNNGWHVTVEPNGIIDGQYEFLFYESLQPDYGQYEAGWVVAQDRLEDFFRNNMALTGFNQKEIDDFIEYWIPRLTEYPCYAIYPQYNDELDEMIKLNFSTQPTNLIRLIYSVRGLETGNLTLDEAVIPAFNRDGFTVAEWGVILK